MAWTMMTKIEYQNKKCHLNYPMRNNSKNLLSSPQFQDDFWHWVLTQLITTFIPNLPSRFLLFHDWGCKFCHPSGKLVVFNVMFNSHAKKTWLLGGEVPTPLLRETIHIILDGYEPPRRLEETPRNLPCSTNAGAKTSLKLSGSEPPQNVPSHLDHGWF